MRELRDIIYLIEQAEQHDEEIVVPDLQESHEDGPSVVDRLTDLVFTMRAHHEPLLEGQQDSYCLGVEAGLDMAADMLESLMRELTHSNDK